MLESRGQYLNNPLLLIKDGIDHLQVKFSVWRLRRSKSRLAKDLELSQTLNVDSNILNRRILASSPPDSQ